MSERIGLTLSGGGFRAAAFHLGVLKGLARVGWLDRVDVVSGVSGGAMLAAAWLLACRKQGMGLEEFEQRAFAFMTSRFKWRLAWASLHPRRLWRCMLDRTYSLTEVMAEVMDREVYRGATLGALADTRPTLVVNATCVNHGRNWRFTPAFIR